MTAIVTGAGRGLGRALCEGALARNLPVIGVSKSQPSSDWNSKIPFCVSSLQTIDAAKAAFEFVDQHISASAEPVLFNNAGMYIEGSSSKYDDAMVRSAIESNFLTFFNATRVFAERYRRGSIINMCAYNTIYSSADSSLYGAVKAAIARTSESFRLEFKNTDREISICNVFASSINTWSDQPEAGAIPKELAAEFLLDLSFNKHGICVESIVMRAR